MKSLISDAAGSFNQTTVSIGRAMDNLQQKEHLTDESRATMQSMLYHVAAAGDRGSAILAGCNVGRKMWRNAKKKNPWIG